MKLEREIIDVDGLKIAKFKVVYEPIKEEKLEPCDRRDKQCKTTNVYHIANN